MQIDETIPEAGLHRSPSHRHPKTERERSGNVPIQKATIVAIAI
jgi:hypothetical protein